MKNVYIIEECCIEKIKIIIINEFNEIANLTKNNVFEMKFKNNSGRISIIKTATGKIRITHSIRKERINEVRLNNFNNNNEKLESLLNGEGIQFKKME